MGPFTAIATSLVATAVSTTLVPMGNLVVVINGTVTAADSCKLVVIVHITARIVEVIHIMATANIELKAMLAFAAVGVITYLHQRFYQTFFLLIFLFNYGKNQNYVC